MVGNSNLESPGLVAVHRPLSASIVCWDPDPQPFIVFLSFPINGSAACHDASPKTTRQLNTKVISGWPHEIAWLCIWKITAVRSIASFTPSLIEPDAGQKLGLVSSANSGLPTRSL